MRRGAEFVQVHAGRGAGLWSGRCAAKTGGLRFRAADRLSYIVPRPVEVVSALLPLLEEQFTPQTAFERQHPTWTDPAVAATWALGAIVQRTPTPGQAEAALENCCGTERPLEGGPGPGRLRADQRRQKTPCRRARQPAREPRFNLGSELKRTGKVADAEAEYRSALALYPGARRPKPRC